MAGFDSRKSDQSDLLFSVLIREVIFILTYRIRYYYCSEIAEFEVRYVTVPGKRAHVEQIMIFLYRRF